MKWELTEDSPLRSVCLTTRIHTRTHTHAMTFHLSILVNTSKALRLEIFLPVPLRSHVSFSITITGDNQLQNSFPFKLH